VFERRGDDLRELLAPVSRLPREVARDWRDRGVDPDLFIGDGVDAYEDVIGSTWPAARRVLPAPPLAPIAGVLASRRGHAAVAPHAIVPVYVRAADAELARELGRTKNEQ
jgi:hypothetical protein